LVAGSAAGKKITMLGNQKNIFMMKIWKIIQTKENEEDEEEPTGINEIN